MKGGKVKEGARIRRQLARGGHLNAMADAVGGDKGMQGGRAKVGARMREMKSMGRAKRLSND